MVRGGFGDAFDPEFATLVTDIIEDIIDIIQEWKAAQAKAAEIPLGAKARMVGVIVAALGPVRESMTAIPNIVLAVRDPLIN